MLAHLKAKHRELSSSMSSQPVSSSNVEVQAPSSPADVDSGATHAMASANVMASKDMESHHPSPEYASSPAASLGAVEDEESATQMTCDVLCSLSSSYPVSPAIDTASEASNPTTDSMILSCGSAGENGKRKGKACPKQHQLPMFLSKTYHMIDRCDSSIATWSAAGDNFVVKNVEKFASHVLPLYFKHSNFSSFARQLNFYGFRKLRTDPILTSDVDPRTACYVRFYHEKFQKDRPELLHQIKRATKSDQQSKDDVESLKIEVSKLKDCMNHMANEMDRKLAEMSYEYNRRITAISGEYDKLAALVQQLLVHQQQLQQQQQQQQQDLHPQTQPSQPRTQPTKPQPQSHKQKPSQPQARANTEAPIPSASQRVPDLMQSLSQVAAMSLQNQLRPPVSASSMLASNSGDGISAGRGSGYAASTAASMATAVALPSSVGTKRTANEESEPSAATPSSRPRTS